MNYREPLRDLRRPGRVFRPVVLVAILAPLAIQAGCEHRMSLSEFQACMEQATHERPQPKAPLDEAARALIGEKLGPYRIGPDDVLSVTVTPAGMELPTVLQARVDTNGVVELPSVGMVKVGDMTVAQAEKAIQQAYVPQYYVQAITHIDLFEVSVTDVMVLGAVSLPGVVSLQRNERNLVYATARAGGSSDMASGLVTLKRLRNSGEGVTFNLRDPEQVRQALVLGPLESGDIVTVHSAKPNTIFIGGLVNVVGPQSYPTGTRVTALQALAAAGGVRQDLIPTEATLIRRVNGEDVHVKLNLYRLATGKDENILLKAGDILWVPHTVGTRIHEFVNNTIYVRAGAVYTASYADIGSSLYGDEKKAGRDSTTIIAP